jgi:CxxC-x17-CxxC domain-containing protein
MEQHRDEQIECADCGASFVFSAAEAAVFAERGLSAPKRCKDCRRARKSQGGGGQRPQGGRAPGNGGNGDSWNGARAQGRFNGPPRRYTGDVNEYRSPMADNYSSSYAAPRPFAPRGPVARGEYRSPMPDGFNGGAPRFDRGRPGNGQPRGDARGPRFDAPRGPRHGDGNRRNGAPNGEGFHAHGDGPARSAGPKRSRPPAEMFAITCSSCGQSAEVPFKPAEGRDVFCPTCYRARRPQA